jgi:NAD(P)-dependent dehydrogenase (short-subunit alcohol dehydrogenase family)
LRGLKDRIAIVTGGGQGIGRALMLRLVEEGCKVAIFDLKPEAAKETEGLAPAGRVFSYELDVGDYGAVAAAVARGEAELGPVRALVNNAGWDRPAPFLAKRSFNADSENIRGISLAMLDTVKLFYETEESKEGVRAFKERRKPEFHAHAKYPCRRVA